MTNNINKYKIICATPLKKEEFKEKSQLSLFLDKNMVLKNSHIIYENKEGLSKIYNSFINETNKDYYLLFLHDDILIEDIFLFEKLDIAFSKYDIVGLAGSKQCNIKSEIPAWHLMSDRSHWVGEVAHSKDKKVWTSVFGPTDSRALVMDGLFLAVNVNKLLETNTKFDENFKFHHYDITFCLRANKNKLKMGVYPIKTTHFGLGDSMMSDDWKKSAELFKKLYSNG
jgi:GT2 family glycosyltransferase